MTLILSILATLRLSEIVIYDTISKPFREKFLGITYDINEEPVLFEDKGFVFDFLQKLFICIRCVSVWVGFFLVLSYLLLPEIYIYLILPFALSQAAIWLNKLQTKLN